MSGFDKLNGIIPLNLTNSLIDYELHIDSKITPKGDNKYSIDHTAKTVIIYLQKLDDKDKKKLQKCIKAFFNDGNTTLIIAKEKTDLLDRLYKYKEKDDETVLSFFKNILSQIDWEALRDSLFLRNEFKKGNNIAPFKADIITRYGARGNLISNL